MAVSYFIPRALLDAWRIVFTIKTQWKMKGKIVTRSQLATAIYQVYVDCSSFPRGLCACYIDATKLLFGIGITPVVLQLFPIFQPPAHLTWGDYWWDIEDVDSRFKFLEKLYTLYKDDKTNLVDIVNAWRDCPTWEEKMVFNKKLIESYENNCNS